MVVIECDVMETVAASPMNLYTFFFITATLDGKGPENKIMVLAT